LLKEPAVDRIGIWYRIQRKWVWQTKHRDSTLYLACRIFNNAMVLPTILMAANLPCLTGSWRVPALNSFVLPIHEAGVRSAPLPSHCSDGKIHWRTTGSFFIRFSLVWNMRLTATLSERHSC